MAASAEVLHQGSKVFWKVRCTVEVVIVNHKAYDVLEVVCFDSVLIHEAARIYLRHSILLKELTKETVSKKNDDVSQPDEIYERNKKLLVNFILERLHIKSYSPKSRLFQIEFQKQPFSEVAVTEDGLDMECTRPFYLEPHVIPALNVVVSKDQPHTTFPHPSKSAASSPSNRSDTSFSTLSMSRSLSHSRDETRSSGAGISVSRESSVHSREGNSIHSREGNSVHSVHSARSVSIHGIASVSHDEQSCTSDGDNTTGVSVGSGGGVVSSGVAGVGVGGRSAGHKVAFKLDISSEPGYISTSARNRLPFSRPNNTSQPATPATNTHGISRSNTNNTHYSNSPSPSPTTTPRLSPHITPTVTPRTQPRNYTHARRRSSMHIGSHIHTQQVAVAAASNATHHAVGSTHHSHYTQHAHTSHHTHHTIHANHSHSPKSAHSQQLSSVPHDMPHTPHTMHTPAHVDAQHSGYTTHPTNPPHHALTLTTHTVPLHTKMKPVHKHSDTLYSRVQYNLSSMFNVVYSIGVCGGSSAVHSVAHSGYDTRIVAVTARKYSVNTAKDSSEVDAASHSGHLK